MSRRFCWRHLLGLLAPRFRAVALDLRGCGASAKPPGRGSYRLGLLLEDLRQVITELLGTPAGTPAAAAAGGDPPRCILVGHDWGGLLAWELATRHPALVEKLVVMAAPHRSVLAGAGWRGDRVGHSGWGAVAGVAVTVSWVGAAPRGGAGGWGEVLAVPGHRGAFRGHRA